MRIFLTEKSTSKGVLLMEALVALLLFMSMSTIIGGYWYYLSSTELKARNRLEAVLHARQATNALIMHHEQLSTTNNIKMQYEYKPVSVISDLDLVLPSISLVTIKIMNASGTMSVKAFYGE